MQITSKHYKLDTCTKTECLIFLSCGDVCSCNQYGEREVFRLKPCISERAKKEKKIKNCIILSLYDCVD